MATKQNKAFWRAANKWAKIWEAGKPITQAEKNYGQWLITQERNIGFATGWIAGVKWAKREAKKDKKSS